MSRRGFTMLEVLITSIVMVLLVLTAYPTLNAATRRQEQVANMTLLETCVTQGIETAKAPTQPKTDVVHIVFGQTPIGCRVTEVSGGATTVTASYDLANPSKYTLTTTPASEYVVSVRPPYPITTLPPSTANTLRIELRSVDTPTVVNVTTFNLVTGTIQNRSL